MAAVHTEGENVHYILYMLYIGSVKTTDAEKETKLVSVCMCERESRRGGG